MPATPIELIDGWLRARLEDGTLAYLDEKTKAARENGAEPGFFLSFSTVARKVGRADLALSKSELDAALAARKGFQPTTWTMAQAARTLLLLSLPSQDGPLHLGVVDQLCEDADLGELIAIYQALPLLPFPEEYRARAAEGVRSNMNAVFEAIALRNPYPSDYLDEAAWNQLVLKCLFVGSPLYLVYGLDDRANPTLARMLCDYAHERWAAHRSVSPELWRCVGAFADGPMLVDLERVIATGTEPERAGAALSARHNPNAEAVLAVHEAAVEQALAQFPTWDAVAHASR
ncbi:MAG TPA: EboA domain-containing protein [Polyangiaceae bacterium]|nr:EboA domain-containing protein [Polyangiaceae bacterium]